MRFGDVRGMQAAPDKDASCTPCSASAEAWSCSATPCPATPVTAGGNIHVALDFDDPADMTRSSTRSPAGGKVM